MRTGWSTLLCWVVAGALIAVHFALLLKYATNVPYSDDYDNLLRFYEQAEELSGTEFIRVLFSQHNEHRLLFNRLVFLVERALAGGTDLRRLIAFGSFGTVVLLAALAWQFRRAPRAPLATAVAAAMLFQPAAHEAAYWAMDMLQRNYVMVFALLSFCCLARKGEGSFYGAALLACLSLYTQASGAVALVVGGGWLGLRALRPTRAGARRQFLVWMLIAAAALAGYFGNYHAPPGHPPITDAIVHPIRTVHYLLAFAGSGAGYLGVAAACAAGAALLGLFGLLTYCQHFRRQPAVYAFIVFLLAGAGMTALGRSGFGPEQAVSSRYALPSCVLMASVLAAAVTVLTRRTRIVAALIVSIALAQVALSYAHNLPSVRAHRETLLRGAALFFHRGISAQLQFPLKIQAAKLLTRMQAHGHYAPPAALSEVDTPGGEYSRLAVFPIAGSPRGHRGDLATRIGGHVSIAVAAPAIRIEGRTDIPEGDIEGALYILAPVLPESIAGGELVEDDGSARSAHGPGSNGFEMTLHFPPQTDVRALADEMCIGFESLSTPLTLFAGNPAICAQHLLDPARAGSG